MRRVILLPITIDEAGVHCGDQCEHLETSRIIEMAWARCNLFRKSLKIEENPLRTERCLKAKQISSASPSYYPRESKDPVKPR